MVGLWNLVVSLFIFIPLLGMANGFAIRSKDSKMSPPPSYLPSLATFSTETPSDIDAKTPQSTHPVPLDILKRDKRRSSSISLVKREIDPMDEEKVNGMPYYTSLMFMPKRTALGISKLLQPFYDSSNRGHISMYDSQQLEPLNKERNNLQPSALYLSSYPDGIKREGQKGRSNGKYLKCFFNAVSCFRK